MVHKTLYKYLKIEQHNPAIYISKLVQQKLTFGISSFREAAGQNN